jgi:hypothetical protein
MASLFVANMSKQHQDFTFRLPGDPATKSQMIRVGTQQRIGGDLKPEIIAKIIEQHTPYGLKAARELPRNREFVGLCYSVDTPVQLEHWGQTLEMNDDVLNDRAEQRREDTAATIANSIQHAMQERGVTVPHAEVSIVEDARPGDTPRIARGYETSSEGQAPRHASKPGRRSRQQSRQ